ncbi:hypothetical protein BZA05DRAFT_58545 [Tricharina praecox]|uniref:uncharacterized protein n=1 Tax=Tricharina praecox TaxID=43433 RepID=UPI002220A979|nr:uncharacterized protein BZA05DRAFT_58545 [Tricharina praecox]KAI5850604.1 hypothetical protein BZA05DRAFT_58545 [Tricharina praecox]
MGARFLVCIISFADIFRGTRTGNQYKSWVMDEVDGSSNRAPWAGPLDIGRDGSFHKRRARCPEASSNCGVLELWDIWHRAMESRTARVLGKYRYSPDRCRMYRASFDMFLIRSKVRVKVCKSEPRACRLVLRPEECGQTSRFHSGHSDTGRSREEGYIIVP